MPRSREDEGRRREGQRLSRIRDQLGLTQRQLAAQFGVASSAVAQWESGKHTIPGPGLRLLELYEHELGLSDVQPAHHDPPVGWGARASRSAAAAALWLVFFGTRDDSDAHPLLHEVRRAAIRHASQLVGELKGLAGKLEQMAAFADFILPEADRAQLAALRGRSRPMSRAALCQVFVGDFGKTPRQIFADWAPEPFATASIGQVHKAKLADGRVVAVKVQYPRIVEALQLDLSQVALIDRVLSLFLPSAGRRELIEEMRERILEECDYPLEARHQREFAGFFTERDDIHVPGVVDELTTRHVLTSELVEGQPLDVFAARASAAARNQAGTTILDFYWTGFRQRRMFNTDANPGNFLFSPERVTFLDFGRMKQLSPGFARQLRRLMRAALERDRAAARTLLIEMGATPNPEHYDFEHTFRGILLLLRPLLTDVPFTYSNDFLRRLWRAFVLDNPNLHKTRFTADMAFLHQFNFGVTAVLARLGATVGYRSTMLDLLYSPGENRPPPFAEAELALLDL